MVGMVTILSSVCLCWGAPHGVVVTQAPGLMTNTPDFWAQIEIAFNPSAAINCSEPD